MKLKKILIFIGTILIMLYPTMAYAWLQPTTYEACNIINMIIAGVMRLFSGIIAIIYTTMVIAYIRYSKQEKKIKKILIWLMIIIIQIAILIFGAYLVTKIGMETYAYRTHERYQATELETYISNSIRTMALISIIFYTIKSIVYFKKSEEKNIQKVKNLVKWQLVTWVIVAILLNLARIW